MGADGGGVRSWEGAGETTMRSPPASARRGGAGAQAPVTPGASKRRRALQQRRWLWMLLLLIGVLSAAVAFLRGVVGGGHAGVGVEDQDGQLDFLSTATGINHRSHHLREQQLPVLAPHLTQVVQESFILDIKVLACRHLDGLQRLLNSLARVNYTGDWVNLDVLCDRCGDAAHNRRCRDIATSMDWPHGSQRVIWRARPAGWTTAWLEAFEPVSLKNVGLILEEDTEVSPLMYQFLRNMVMEYYVRETDPHAASICLHPVWHEDYKSQPIYRSPRACEWAMLALPTAWQSFRSWLDAQAGYPDQTPQHWTLLWNQFLSEHRLYTIHYAFPRALRRERVTGFVVKNKRTRMGEDLGSDVALEVESLPQYLNLPPLGDLPFISSDHNTRAR